MYRCLRLSLFLNQVNLNASLTKEERTAIIKEKHHAIMKPMLYVLTHLRGVTVDVVPQTPHEQHFQHTFKPLVDAAIEQLENPSHPQLPTQTWHPVRLLHQALQRRSQRKSAHLLDMRLISPRLAQMTDSLIPMPGVFSPAGTPRGLAAHTGVTIAQCETAVPILPTKTKPKKLVFHGSDGRQRPYLFKGLEDLHLDERIMQFLSITNALFAQSHGNAASKKKTPSYRARHYSVTPLGTRSGLIQWVEGATPLFSLYKKWQQREAVIESQKKEPSTSENNNNNNSSAPSVPRPTEIYYNKISPALKELGLSATAHSRKDWPVSLMKSVFHELVEETPADLLAREMWLSRVSAAEWWTTTRAFARSSAVMSVIGYLLGLGDRHLDNVLIDLATGEVVHIDYNVCFEKGSSLRIPEKVPFRLTQNLEAALGVTGVEGTFRVACEHVMQRLRRGRDTLLTLLEAFIYDPLVDWTLTGSLHNGFAGAFHGGAGGLQAAEVHASNKQEMERDIHISMFDIRIAEMKTAWMKNGTEMAQSLSALVEEGTEFQEAIQAEQNHRGEEAALMKRTQLVRDSLRDTNHPLHTLKERFGTFFDVRKRGLAVTEKARKTYAEHSSWASIHRHALTLLLTGASDSQAIITPTTMNELYNNVSAPLTLGRPPYVHAMDFLQSAGQSQVVQSCQEAEERLTNLLLQRQSAGLSGLRLLQNYQSLLGQLPTSYVKGDRCVIWQDWLQALLDANDEKQPHEQLCRQILEEFKESCQLSASANQAALMVETKLKTIWQESAETHAKIAERMRKNAQAKLAALEGRSKAHLPNDPVSSLSTQLSVKVTEAAAAIRGFAQEDGGSLSISTVLLTALVNSAKKFLEMEKAASAAGDRLTDLTSMTGTWFLEEFGSISANVAEMVSMLQECSSGGSALLEYHPAVNPAYLPLIEPGGALVLAFKDVFSALQELLINFKRIILPECLKCFRTEDATVVTVADGLRQLLKDCESWDEKENRDDLPTVSRR